LDSEGGGIVTYSKTTWVDGENKYDITTQAGAVIEEDIKLVYKGSTGTPMSAQKLNNIEDAIEALDALNVPISSGNAEYTDSVPAASTLTKTIAIGTGKTHGMAVIGVRGTYAEKGVLTSFTTDIDGNLSAGFMSSDGGAVAKAYLGKVTDEGGFGQGCTGAAAIRIDSFYINGSNLTIVFRNTLPESAASLNCRVDWRAW
jgi:hypothetical protein